MPNESKDRIEVLECHGVHFNKRPSSGTAQGDCPFCGKPDHFFCHVSTGRWQCKVCHKEGNAFSFLTEHYQSCLKDTKKGDYETLSSQRSGLAPAAWKNAKYAYDRGFNRWLIPQVNGDVNLANLLHWDGFSDQPRAYSTTTCKLHLGGIEKLKNVGPIWICEGPFDGAALSYLFDKCGRDLTTNSVLWVPGAGFSLEPYLDKFKGRDVYFLYDNDPAGIDGQSKESHRIKKVAKSVHRIHWPSAYPEKYDIRDFVTEKISNPKKCIQELDELFKYEEKVPKKNLPKVPNFKALVREFRKVLHLEQNQLDALAVCTAVVASTGSRGTPLWLFLVGPPGCGKSEMLLAFSRLEDKCLFLSRLTSEAFISGYSGQDCSVMSYLANRTLIIKDFTSVKAMSQEKQTDLFGMLRDAYDGEVAKPFGNDAKVRSYTDCWFPMLAGVTHVIHADNQSAYGERFLKFELLDDDHDVMKQTRASMAKAKNDAKAAVPDETLRNAVMAFFEQRPLVRDKLPTIPVKYEAKLEALAHVVAVIRTSADRKGNVYAYRPQPENPGRLGSQFVKLAQHLCWVLDKPKMDDEVYAIIRKVATDTVVSWSLELIRALVKSPKGVCMHELTRSLQVAVETIKPHLETLCQIIYPYAPKNHGPVVGMIDTPITVNSPRNHRTYKIDQRFMQLWRTAELPLNLISSQRKQTRGPKRGSTYHKKRAS